MTACACSERSKKVWIFGCGSFFLLAGMILAVVWSAVSVSILHNQLVLKNGSQTYNNWIETPIPMYLEFYMFNWTNPDKIHNWETEKPHFVEMGPYVFTEKRKRVNIVWNNNGTVSFNQSREWHFVPEMSNGTLDDKVTNLNLIPTTIAYTLRHQSVVVKMIVNFLFKEKGARMTITRTVRELLFDGYDDPILDFVRKLNISGFVIPFKKVGWFVERNQSATHDGHFSIFTGDDDMAKLGVMEHWNYVNHTQYYRDQCGAVTGTTGEIWPPLPADQSEVDIAMFTPDICRTITLKYDRPVEKLGLSGNRWVADERVLDNGWKYPPAACYCTADPSACPDLLPGVLNVSSCQFGAPAFMSFPHFYLADSSYSDAIAGLNASREEHEFYMALQPQTGIPLDIRGQLQLNLMMTPDEHFSIFEKVPKIFIPMLWFRQTANLTEDLAKSAWWAVNLSDFGLYLAFGIVGLGGVLVIVGIVLTITKKWTCAPTNEDEEPLQ
ncbi:protein croquemort-like [Phlebotomus argentipes]|uniref:protein croquemort-like n=1 Tax=Phlebotomus argentipes TaxID=94469 RepID=UPI002892B148|nr:protein croquemort-like [Phlebotomus argentipes]XP_059617326.1 protein croquemort-like [Phlebotomus argentipes]